MAESSTCFSKDETPATHYSVKPSQLLHHTFTHSTAMPTVTCSCPQQGGRIQQQSLPFAFALPAELAPAASWHRCRRRLGRGLCCTLLSGPSCRGWRYLCCSRRCWRRCRAPCCVRPLQRAMHSLSCIEDIVPPNLASCLQPYSHAQSPCEHVYRRNVSTESYCSITKATAAL